MTRLEWNHARRQVIPEATSRGIVSDGLLVAGYYTAEPSPGKWVAVATVMFWPGCHDDGSPRWMLVGEGCSEQRAVAHLRDRMKTANPPRWRITRGSRPAVAGHIANDAAAWIPERCDKPRDVEMGDADVLADAATM